MNFDQWLTGHGYDVAALNAPEQATQRKHLELAWNAETQPPEKPPMATIVPPNDAAAYVDQAALDYEIERKKYISDKSYAAMQTYADKGDHEKYEQIKKLRAASLEDKKTDKRAFDFALYQLDRMLPSMTMPQGDNRLAQDVVEAAVCISGGMKSGQLEKHFNERTLHAAEKHFGQGMGLQDLVVACAQANGYRVRGGFRSDMSNIFRAACGVNARASYGDMYASGGAVPSTYSLPNVFSTVANKFMRMGFDAVESAWREISTIVSRSDFKASTSIALTGTSTFDELPPTGEIKHGTVSETTYANQVKTYAQMLGFDRQHLINDDLGVLTNGPRLLGMTAARTINKKFWAEFLDNSAFFTSGNSNVITGGGSALSSSALKLADAKFRQQTEPSGSPLGISPAILLVPPTLAYTARELMNSSYLIGTPASNALSPSANIFQGAYRLVVSNYLEDTTLTGYSTAAWYLLASPGELPVIETAFLNGRAEPTIESAEMDFNRLGMVSRAWIDMGVALQEYRAGVRAAGS